MVSPLVEALRTLRGPLVFATACPDWSLPGPYEALPHGEKPLDQRALLRELAALGRARRSAGPLRTRATPGAPSPVRTVLFTPTAPR